MPSWSEPKDAAYIFEMLRAIDDIEGLIKGEDEDAFIADQSKPHALAMFFIVLGESANKVSKTMKSEHPEIAWSRIAGLRHIIVHEYRRIDHRELWKIARSDVPTLKVGLPRPPSPPELF